MELIEAKAILKNALNLAVLKGCFSLDDVALIVEALKVNEQSDNLQENNG
jgi:hypothetical protein